MDMVFKALADDTRRRLLDLLRERNGRTLGELCAPIDMARQSVTQHLAVLEAANLVVTVRRGREKLHYLNPVPLHEIEERWIGRFERPRLRVLSDVKRRAEEAMTDKRHSSTSPTSPVRRRRSGTPSPTRPHRRLLGPQQCLRLADRLALGACAHRRLRHRRRRRHRGGERAPDPAGDHLDRAGERGARGHVLPGHLRPPAARRHRPGSP